jgi:hypothetical protein
MRKHKLLYLAVALTLLHSVGAAAQEMPPLDSNGVPVRNTLAPNEYLLNDDGATEDPNARMSDVARAYRNGYINRGKADDAILKEKLAELHEADMAANQPVRPPLPPSMMASAGMPPPPDQSVYAPPPPVYQPPPQPAYQPPPVYQPPQMVVQQVYSPPPPPPVYVQQPVPYVATYQPVAYAPPVSLSIGWPVFRGGFYGWGGFRGWR